MAHPVVVAELLGVEKTPHTLEMVIRILAFICPLDSVHGLSSMAVSGLLTSHTLAWDSHGECPERQRKPGRR